MVLRVELQREQDRLAQKSLRLCRQMCGVACRAVASRLCLKRASVAAPPPDVRRGLPRRSMKFNGGLCPWFGLCPNVMGQRPYDGHSPIIFHAVTARHSLASHPAAEP